MIKAILTDIEGTTSSIAFVRDVLFPYAQQHLPMFIRANATDENVRVQLQAAAKIAGIAEDDYPAIIDALRLWMAQDQKVTPLKTLQGLLWAFGYRNGDFRAHVYRDAYDMLQAWHAKNLLLYVYSSGSIQAQKLFFEFSEYGDMTPLFSDYFDTTGGAKRDSASYQRIAEKIGISTGDILFLSDIAAELDAAKLAGLQTCWLVRPTDSNTDEKTVAQSVHPVARDFFQVGVSAENNTTL